MRWILRKLGEKCGLSNVEFAEGFREGFNHQVEKQVGERLDDAMLARDVFIDSSKPGAGCNPIEEHITSAGRGLICDALENGNHEAALSFVDVFKIANALPYCLSLVKQAIVFAKKEQCSKLIAGATMNLIGCPNPYL